MWMREKVFKLKKEIQAPLLFKKDQLNLNNKKMMNKTIKFPSQLIILCRLKKLRMPSIIVIWLLLETYQIINKNQLLLIQSIKLKQEILIMSLILVEALKVHQLLPILNNQRKLCPKLNLKIKDVNHLLYLQKVPIKTINQLMRMIKI